MVAPTSATSPSSTAGSSVSCWALLKRWISSRKKIVGSPLVWRRCSARSSTSRTSGAAGVDRRGLLEGGPRVHGQQPGQRRLAGAGRPVEDHRVRAAFLDRGAQRRAPAEQMLLAHELAERRRAHAGGQRLVAGGHRVCPLGDPPRSKSRSMRAILARKPVSASAHARGSSSQTKCPAPLDHHQLGVGQLALEAVGAGQRARTASVSPHTSSTGTSSAASVPS